MSYKCRSSEPPDWCFRLRVPTSSISSLHCHSHHLPSDAHTWARQVLSAAGVTLNYSMVCTSGCLAAIGVCAQTYTDFAASFIAEVMKGSLGVNSARLTSAVRHTLQLRSWGPAIRTDPSPSRSLDVEVRSPHAAQVDPTAPCCQRHPLTVRISELCYSAASILCGCAASHRPEAHGLCSGRRFRRSVTWICRHSNAKKIADSLEGQQLKGFHLTFIPLVGTRAQRCSAFANLASAPL